MLSPLLGALDLCCRPCCTFDPALGRPRRADGGRRAPVCERAPAEAPEEDQARRKETEEVGADERLGNFEDSVRQALLSPQMG